MLLTFVVLLLIAALVVQIILWTNLPRQIVLSRLQTELGLRVTARSVRTGWLGHTTMDDLTLALPLADKPFLHVPTMRVRNNTLFSTLAGRKVRIYAIDLSSPIMEVTQNVDGRWNVQDLAELVARSPKPPDRAPVHLPDLHVHRATVLVRDRLARQATVEPVDADGFADTPLSWKFNVNVPSRINLSGRLVPSGIWEHEGTAKAQDVATWMRPWFATFPADASLEAHWRGQVRNQVLSGRLDLAQLAFGGVRAAGGVTAVGQNGLLTLSPTGLTVHTGAKIFDDVTLLSGQVSYDGKIVRGERIEVAALGGPARISGSYDRTIQAGEIHAAWEKLLLPWAGIRHDGKLDASIQRPFPQQMVVDATLTSTGSTPQGPWQVEASLGGRGSGFGNLDWQVDAKKFNWQRHDPINLDGVTFRGNVRPTSSDPAVVAPVFSLTSIDRPGDHLGGHGSYNFARRSWLLALEGQHWMFHPVEGIELRFVLRAFGDTAAIHLQEFTLHHGAAELSADGSYQYDLPKPLNLTVKLVNHPAPAGPADNAPILRGSISGEAKLNGTVVPLQLSLAGSLSGRDVHWGDRPISSIDLAMRGEVDPEKVDVHTETLALLGGNWDLRGIYSFAGAAMDVQVGVRGLSLTEVFDVARTRGIAGTLDGDWDVYLPGIRPNPRSLRLRGDAAAKNVRAPGFQADSVQFTTVMQDGVLAADPLTLRLGDTGKGRGRVLWNINNVERLQTALNITHWPIVLPERAGRADVSLNTDSLAITFPRPADPNPAARMPRLDAERVELHAGFQTTEQPVGTVQATLALNGRALEVRHLHADAAGGHLDGSGRIDVDDPNHLQGNLDWDAIDTERIFDLFPSLRGMGGTLKGSAHIGPATTSRPLGPLAISIDNQWNDGWYRTVPLKDLHIAAFLEMRPGTFKPERLVFADTLSEDSVLHADGGTVHLWARASRHNEDFLAMQAQVVPEGLDLDPLVHAFNALAKPVPGVLSGKITLLYDTPMSGSGQPESVLSAVATAPTTRPAAQVAFEEFLKRLYADGRLSLTHSNLANVGFVSTLFNLMHLSRDVGRPSGTGFVRFHLEQGVLSITRMKYFNRGTEVSAVARIPEAWHLPDSPISGSAAASARPLKSIKLPYIADVDQILSILQADIASVNITGTVRHMVPVPVPFKSITDTLRGLVLGDIRGETSGSAEE